LLLLLVFNEVAAAAAAAAVVFNVAAVAAVAAGAAGAVLAVNVAAVASTRGGSVPRRDADERASPANVATALLSIGPSTAVGGGGVVSLACRSPALRRDCSGGGDRMSPKLSRGDAGICADVLRSTLRRDDVGARTLLPPAASMSLSRGDGGAPLRGE
jgi:hypothetical protein